MSEPLNLESFRKIPLAYASCSIGCHPSDTLPRKLQAISNAAFNAIELSFPDIQSYAQSIFNTKIEDDNFPALCKAAADIGRQCKALNLEIMMLQPFANFEGWPRGSVERENAFARAKGWIQIMNACGTDLLQVGATDTPGEKISTRREDIVEDLRQLADMLAREKYRMAYENWCWSTHAPTWKDVWEIVKAVDRPNVGLCLDTFQTAGAEWGDPTTASGLIEDVPKEELDKRFAASMDELARSIPPEKIYLLQISDVYKPVQPLERKDINGLRPRGRWSHDFRPMPYDGGYLPIEQVTKAVLKTGFRGYFSMEIFDSGPDGKGKDYEMEQFALKAQQSMQTLFKNCADE
ncbi:3-dehydroshikimate dehydratase [Rasamsonia emersonii CBS 393.64]|uniref:3-dehydroshikimate dehydratase n=1 Tax=Rasamsonia emersonii (strain ATCC 16479 / CBS 393.64 / IMI 116815) TaxID=1408163 RepID=A0A0F4YPQ2_RASE3|nr:3-dehydroshikimate dehydratase [Rasamsonia emersonii CBS 393.64]KKA20242.1 3-dehydroshikimate dehydratase [Rasamsonia emersonii CBS 393.64]